MLVYAGQTAWRVDSGAGAWVSGDLCWKASTKDYKKPQQSTQAAAGCLLEHHQVFYAKSLIQLEGMEVWGGGGHMLACPPIKWCNDTKALACRKWEEGRGGNVKHAPSSNSHQCALKRFVDVVNPGSSFSSCSVLLGSMFSWAGLFLTT